MKLCQHISDSLTEFTEINDKGDVSDSVLWETFKVVMRGHIISYESAGKKLKTLGDRCPSYTTGKMI